MNKLRIISGKWKGMKINGVDWEGTRPLTDMIKENIFNLIMNRVHGDVLDLFAGSGSFGIEAASRGARFIVFNELNLKPRNILNENTKKIGLDKYEMNSLDCFDYLKTCIKKFDIIFLDPPFNFFKKEKLLESIYEGNLLKDSGIIILRIPVKDNLGAKNFTIWKERKYGASKVLILEKQNESNVTS